MVAGHPSRQPALSSNMTKKIQVSRPVCFATAAGRVFGPLKALIKHDEENPSKPACLLRDSGGASFWPAEGSVEVSVGTLFPALKMPERARVRLICESRKIKTRSIRKQDW